MTRSFHCNNPDPDFPGCDAKFQNFWLDGYDVGDRLLEGVRFSIWHDDEEWHVVVHADDADYFEQFNATYWYDTIKDYVKTLDFAQCPMCRHNDFIVNQDVVDSRKVHKVVRTEVSYFSAEELNARDAIRATQDRPPPALDYSKPIQSGSVVVEFEADPLGVSFMRDMQAMADSRLPIERESDEDEEDEVLWDTLMPPFQD